MRRTILAFVLLAACDQPQATPADSAPPVAASAASAAPTSPSLDAAPAPPPPAPASTWDGSMPTRPVPRASPTVGAGMPAQVQMEAIAYMAAMGQPRFDDANADPDWAASFAERLRPVVRSLDKGSAEDKEKLDRVEVIGSGRKIDLLMAAGCDAEAPTRAVVTRTSTPLSTLLAHGVLVVRCNDARAQCLQSTRDPTDVLCTTAPRHR